MVGASGVPLPQQQQQQLPVGSTHQPAPASPPSSRLPHPPLRPLASLRSRGGAPARPLTLCQAPPPPSLPPTACFNRRRRRLLPRQSKQRQQPGGTDHLQPAAPQAAGAQRAQQPQQQPHQRGVSIQRPHRRAELPQPAAAGGGPGVAQVRASAGWLAGAGGVSACAQAREGTGAAGRGGLGVRAERQRSFSAIAPLPAAACRGTTEDMPAHTVVHRVAVYDSQFRITKIISQTDILR